MIYLTADDLLRLAACLKQLDASRTETGVELCAYSSAGIQMTGWAHELDVDFRRGPEGCGGEYVLVVGSPS